jgi:hypothetical protein
VILYLYHNIFCYSLRKSDCLVHHMQLHICREQRFITKQIVVCYLGYYVDTRSNIIEGVVKDSLSNCVLDRWYARIFLLSKEWWSEQVIILWSEGIDHIN